jgi:hypothetical protein
MRTTNSCRKTQCYRAARPRFGRFSRAARFGQLALEQISQWIPRKESMLCCSLIEPGLPFRLSFGRDLDKQKYCRECLRELFTAHRSRRPNDSVANRRHRVITVSAFAPLYLPLSSGSDGFVARFEDSSWTSVSTPAVRSPSARPVRRFAKEVHNNQSIRQPYRLNLYSRERVPHLWISL